MRTDRSSVKRALPLLCLLAWATSCGGSSGPKYTLKMVMLEMELKRGQMEKALLRDGGAADVETIGLEMLKWLDDPAAAAYLERTDIKGTPAQFRAFDDAFRPRLAAVIDAARAGDEAAARTAFPDLEAGCNACHAVFRPDLAAR